MAHSILETTGEALLLQRLQDPYLEALFVSGVDAALRTGMNAKRRLLVRAVCEAVLDDAALEESMLLADALAQLDVPHVRALARLSDEWDLTRVRTSVRGVHVGRSAVWQEMQEPIKATLVRTGTAKPSPSMFTGHAEPIRVEGITDFGLAVVAQLRSEGWGRDDQPLP